MKPIGPLDEDWAFGADGSPKKSVSDRLCRVNPSRRSHPRIIH